MQFYLLKKIGEIIKRKNKRKRKKLVGYEAGQANRFSCLMGDILL